MFERGGEVRSGGEGEEVEARRGGQGGEGEGRSLFLGRVGEGWNGGVFTICACIHVESGVSWSYMYKSGMTTCVIQVCFVLLLQCY